MHEVKNALHLQTAIFSAPVEFGSERMPGKHCYANTAAGTSFFSR